MVFALSKILWAFARPSMILVLLALSGFVLILRTRDSGAGVVLLSAGMIGIAACTFLPLGTWLLRPLENRFPALTDIREPIDGIILLGGAVDMPTSVDRGHPALNIRADRIVQFVALARRFSHARLLLTGGNASLGLVRGTEADEMRELVTELGVAPDRLILEKRSRNTRENALYSRDEIRPDPSQRWLLVTSAADMPRAVGCFRAVGWPVIAAPSDYHTRNGTEGWTPEFVRSLQAVDWAAHEWVGLFYYYLRGWSSSLFPGPAS